MFLGWKTADGVEYYGADGSKSIASYPVVGDVTLYAQWEFNSQTIDFSEIEAQVATNTVTLGATASSGLAVSYAAEGPAVLEGSVLTFTGAGTVTVTASQKGDEEWGAAEDVVRSFEVTKAVADVLLGNLEQVHDGQTHRVGVETVPEELGTVVTYDGSDAEPVGAGSYVVLATVVDDIWEGSAEGTLVISRGAQTIEFPEMGPQLAPTVVELGAVASSGLAVNYAVEGPGVLEGNLLSFTGVGTVTVTASQPGDANWEAAEDVVRSFQVVKGTAEVTLGGLSQAYDGAAREVSVETVPEGLSVLVTYDGTEAAPTNTGSYGVVATVVDDRWEGSAAGTLVVSRGSQSIEFAEIGSCGVTERLELSAEASSGLAVTFAVVSGPALLEGGMLRFTETGMVTVAAMQFGDANWLAAETVVQEFAVVKSVAQVSLEGLVQTFDGTEKSVTVVTVPEGLAVVVTYDGEEAAPTNAGSYAVWAVVEDAKWEGSAEGTLVIARGGQSIEFPEIGAQTVTNEVTLGAVASSGLGVSYEVEGPAVLEENVLTFTGVGEVTVTASQAGNANWEAAESVSVSFAVEKATALVTLGRLAQAYDGEAKAASVETVPEGLVVVVTYDGSEESPVAAGSYSVEAVVEDAMWEGSATGTLEIAKGAQSIVFEAIGAQVATNVVALGAVASSGLGVAYEVEGPAVLEENVLRFTGAGEVTVTANQAGDDNWAEAEPVSVSFAVVKAAAEVRIYGLLQVYDGGARGVEVETEPAGLSVGVTYDGAVDAPTNAGEYAVEVVVEDAIWEGSAERTLVVSKGSQSIAFEDIEAQVATNTVTLEAVASSGLAVSYEVEGPVVLEGGELTFTGAGEVTVTASQAGDENWEAAESVSVSFTVGKAMAEVRLEGLEQSYNGEARAVVVTTVPEGLKVVVRYDGEDGAPTNAGRYTVSAVVEDALWEGRAEGTLVVSKGEQSIDFPAIGTWGGGERLALAATASSGLEVTFAVLSGPAILEGASLRFAETGMVTIAAMQFGDANWQAAETVRQEFAVVKSVAQVTLEGMAQTFDGTEKMVSVTTMPEGLAVSVTYDGAVDAPVGAGRYAVIATVQDALWAGSAEGTLEVTVADISEGEEGEFAVVLGANPKYDGTEQRVEVESATWKGLPVTFEVEGNAAVDAGSYTLTVTGTGNFAGAQAAEWAVLRRTVTLTSAGASKAYDGEALTAQEVTVGGDGFAEGEGAEFEWTGSQTDVGRSENGFSYTLLEGTKAGNYDISTAFGTLEVTAADISEGEEGEFAVVLGANPKYDGTEQRVEVESATWKGLPVTFEVEGNAAEDAGAYTLTVTGTGNFAGVQTAEWEVLKREVTLTSAGASKAYDGEALTAQEVTVGGDGWAPGEGAEYEWAGSQTEVGRSENGFTYTLNEGTKAGNYNIATVFGVLEVTKGAQTIDFPEIGGQTVTNAVVLGAVASSGLEVGYEVLSGPGKVEGNVLTFTGVGEVVVRASQGGDGNWEAAESVERTVEVSGWVTLTVASAHGTAEPGVGAHEVLLGAVVEASVAGSPVELGEGRRAVCTGWRLEGEEMEGMWGEEMSVSFMATGDAVLTWTWETQVLVQAEGLAHGEAEGSGWYAVGETAVLRAVPAEGHSFTGWEGDFGTSMANPREVRVTRPGLAVATFYTTYYAREDGDNGADGLSRGTAKREISAALAEAAFGDAVVAGEGMYGAISVPEGVEVRSEEGAEKTVIRGGIGTRCVQASADAVVEGFALEWGDVKGDGGGALLADGAELRRCILRVNKATGAGGGAKGGALENCLVVGNEAWEGGGVAGAELRHCTVVLNAGGGAKDCRSINCVFWENDRGDVEGGTTSWSLCSPLAAGTGNIEDDPKFVGEDDWRLAYESPCIDAAGESGVRVDLAGAPRPQPKVFGGELKPDMGCYEYVPKARFVWEQGRGVPPFESWSDAAHDIQSALDISAGGDRVVVEAGTYGPVTVSNAVILMGYRGAEETIIDGGNADRAVTMTGGGVLEGFTIRNGASEDCGGILADGGAVVRNVVVEGCRATGAEGVGGGLCLYGGSVAENVTASGNAAAYGAGVWATATSAVLRCELAGNAASARGGGAWLDGESRMEGSVAADNTAVRGAGVYGEHCEIVDSEMRGNVAAGAGGGAAAVGATFRNNVVTGNRAASGGGLWTQNTDGHDCLVVGNSASRGAGLWAEGDGQLWNFTVADNEGTGAGVSLRGTALLGNAIVWGNAGGNVDAENGTEIRYSCAEPVSEGEGNFAGNPAFVGGGDYHLRAGSPCVDAGEVQEWMQEAYDFDGQRRVEVGVEGDGRDIWVDVGADEAAVDAVGMPTKDEPWWTWRVVMDARLQLQSTTNLLKGGSWTDAGEPFTATNQVWTLDEPFEGKGARFYRLIWLKE